MSLRGPVRDHPGPPQRGRPAGGGGRRTAIIVAIISAAGVIIAAIVTGTFNLLANHNGPTPQPSRTAVSHSSSPRPSGRPSAKLTYPAGNTKVSRAKGFIARGIVEGLGANTIWILDHSASGYYVDAEAATPKNGNGAWSAMDRWLGNKSDHLPYSLTVVAVIATPQCKRQLRQIESQDLDTPLGTIPRGCLQFGKVTVEVYRP